MKIIQFLYNNMASRCWSDNNFWDFDKLRFVWVRFGLGQIWFWLGLVWVRFDLSPVWFESGLVRVRFGLGQVWFGSDLVCVRFGLGQVWFEEIPCMNAWSRSRQNSKYSFRTCISNRLVISVWSSRCFWLVQFRSLFDHVCDIPGHSFRRHKFWSDVLKFKNRFFVYIINKGLIKFAKLCFKDPKVEFLMETIVIRLPNFHFKDI